MTTSTSAELEEARSRVKSLLSRLRASGEDLGEFGDDLDLLLNATAPRSEALKRSAPSPRSAVERIRRTDPSTSWLAARSTSPKSTRELYNDIVFVATSNQKITGVTDEELIHVLTEQMSRTYTPSGIRTRRAELVEAGWIRDSGVRRETRSGRPSIVWEWVPTVDS